MQSVLFHARRLCCLTAICLSASTPSDVPTFGTTVVLPSGLRGDVYVIRKGTTVIPEFARANRKPVGSIWTTSLDVPPTHWRKGFPGLTKRFEWFGIDYNGRFWIEKPGRYDFALLSDDGSQLFIDNQLIIDNDCQHPPDVRTASVTLGGGVHRIHIPYFQGPRDCLALILAIAGPDEHWRIFSTDEFKPPSNPDEWKYGSVEDVTVEARDPGTNPVPVTDFLAKLESESALNGGARTSHKKLAHGCVAEPIHSCGQ